MLDKKNSDSSDRAGDRGAAAAPGPSGRSLRHRDSGAGGDLTKRLVIPALYNIARTKVLPKKFALIGVDLAQGTAESWRDNLHDMVKSFVGDATAEFDVDGIDETAWQRLAEKMSYVQGDLTDPDTYEKIRAALAAAEKKYDTQGNVIFYLAVADRFFGTVVELRGKAKLTDQNDAPKGKHRFWRRVVIPHRSRADHRGRNGGRGERGAASSITCSHCYRSWPWSRRPASLPTQSVPRKLKCSPRCPPSSRPGGARPVQCRHGAGKECKSLPAGA